MGRGRPKSVHQLDSKAVNYQALAWQVKERRNEYLMDNKKISIKKACLEIMKESVEQRIKENIYDNNGKLPNSRSIDTRFKTTYTKVRKILRDIEKNSAPK